MLFYQKMWGITVHAFPKGIRPKVNMTAQLKFKLTYYDVTTQYTRAIGLMSTVFTNGPGDWVQSQIESYQ